MGKENHTQLELFSENTHDTGKKNGLSASLLNYIRLYEKTVIITICFIVTAIVSFSLGIERGKQTTLAKSLPPQNKLRIMSQKQILSKPDNTDTNTARFTIQIASYSSKTRAQKEVEKLKNRRLSPMVFFRSGYNIICIGSFLTKEQALTMFLDLKKLYPDCIIRRL